MKSESYVLFSTDLLMPIFLLGYLCLSHIIRFASDTMPPGVYVQSMYTNFATGQSPNQMPAGIMTLHGSDIEKATTKQIQC